MTKVVVISDEKGGSERFRNERDGTISGQAAI